MHVLLVCTQGGHLYQLFSLRDYWSKYERSWVTFDTETVNSILSDEHLIAAFHPTARNIKNLLKNFRLAIKTIREIRPHIIISTGAGLAIPFFYIAKLYGIRTVYIESITRITELSLTGRLVYPVADHFLVQWPELAKKLPKAQYRGMVI